MVRDQHTGRSVTEVRDDSGRYVIEDSGLEYEVFSVDRFAISAGDPLSAMGEVTFETHLGRGEWQTHAVTRTVLTATATDFHIAARLDASDGETVVASREWTLSIPRRHV